MEQNVNFNPILSFTFFFIFTNIIFLMYRPCADEGCKSTDFLKELVSCHSERSASVLITIKVCKIEQKYYRRIEMKQIRKANQEHAYLC